MTERRKSTRQWGLRLALSIVALGAALGGCARDDYYCDSTGCYYCDGVGCRPVTPPTRSSCRGDYECAPNQVCTNLGCATRCGTNADCPRGWICQGGSDEGGTSTGICAAPTETPMPNPGTCRTNADCGGGTVCINGTCTRTTTPACSVDADCSNGQICVGGRCTAPSNTCQFNNQCGAGRVCVNSECRAACDATMACPGTQQCIDGICRERVDGCANDAGCAAGNRCVNGTCYPACGAGMTCEVAGTYCSDEGVCRPDTRPQPFCDASRPCAAGSECVGGICRVPCSTSEMCARVDVSYRNCGRISYLSTTQTYCLTDHEARPLCARQSDCAMGQSCVDGICR